jgi:fermentation-respiration switch protein FrsA (DUF1100 family)
MIFMKSALYFLGLAGGGYLLLLAGMYLFQDKLLFLPSKQMLLTPAQFGLEAEDIHPETRDGLRLHAWYFPAVKGDGIPAQNADRLILISHGNAGNISGRIEMAGAMLQTGAAVLLYDYRGYGKSEGQPDETGLYEDLRAVSAFMIEEKGYSPEDIFLYGRSLGGAVAAHGATAFPEWFGSAAGGLVLDSTFLTLRRMVRDVYPIVPSFLAKYEFNTLARIQELNAHQPALPVMIFHSPQDDVIGFHHGRQLYDALDVENREFAELRGGHNTSFFSSEAIILQHWKAFLEDSATD